MIIATYGPLQRLYDAAKQLLDCTAFHDDDKLHAALKAAVAECEQVAQDRENNKVCADAIAYARDVYIDSSDDIQIDDNPLLSDTEDGIWVQGWLWASYSDIAAFKDLDAEDLDTCASCGGSLTDKDMCREPYTCGGRT